MSIQRSRGVFCVLAVLSGAPVFAQVTRRVSLDSGGIQANSNCTVPSISADGRYVAFESTATNLVTGDTNGAKDVFVHDRVTGTTERVSVDSSGTEGNAASSTPSISADGRYVAFESDATNLVAGDTNGKTDVFVRDLLLGTTERASVDGGGTEGNGNSSSPSISGDGQRVSFTSFATNLVLGDTNGFSDVFVRDFAGTTTERASVSNSGLQANNASFSAAISADGNVVAFASGASNLVTGDTNLRTDVFARDLGAATTDRASVTTGGVQGDASSFNLSISADGRYVAFDTDATNLVAGDTNGVSDILVRDRVGVTTIRVSVDSGGTQGNDSSFYPSISADGNRVAFETLASNLVGGDTNANYDVYVHDVAAGTTERASVDSNGNQGIPAGSNRAAIDAAGRLVAFHSQVPNLVPGDTNFVQDIFVRDTDATSFTSLCDPGVDGVIPCPCANPPAGSGQGCNNSAATGGAILAASGVAYLSADTLVFTTSGEKPTATSVLLQGTTVLASGAVYGQGVRCVGGVLKRLYTKSAVAGSITAPNFGAGDPTVSARSAAKGNPISAGEIRTYLVFYRDPIVLGGCPVLSTFNATQSGRVAWSL